MFCKGHNVIVIVTNKYCCV